MCLKSLIKLEMYVELTSSLIIGKFNLTMTPWQMILNNNKGNLLDYNGHLPHTYKHVY